jgi:hypothetical protein
MPQNALVEELIKRGYYIGKDVISALKRGTYYKTRRDVVREINAILGIAEDL